MARVNEDVGDSVGNTGNEVAGQEVERHIAASSRGCGIGTVPSSRGSGRINSRAVCRLGETDARNAERGEGRSEGRARGAGHIDGL